MNSNQNQPREFDVVLGGKNPPPVTGVVLGGIEGVKRRLESEIVDVRCAFRVKALSDALNYGEAGLDLVIEALEDSSLQVKGFAVRLLKERGGEKGKRALLEFDPYLYFTKLDDWNFQEINPNSGISETVDNAYILTVPYTGNCKQTIDNLFEVLQKPYCSNAEALQCKYGRHTSETLVANALINAKEKLKNIKALYIGDIDDYEYKTSEVVLSDMSPILKAYPSLEVLKVRGFAYDSDCGLAFSPIKHQNLKTLILETGYMLCKKIIDQICELELPALEYLELWLGNDEYYEPASIYYGNDDDDSFNNIEKSALNNLMPIILGKAFPELKYLGLRSCHYSNAIAELIVNSPLLDKLKVIDLSMGNLTNKGAEFLLNCPKINQLHTLDVSMNYLSSNMVEELSNLKCRVIAEPQD